MVYSLDRASENIESYIASYKDLLLGKTEKKYNELYKWRAAKTFRDHWNPDAENISEMMDACFTPSTNLTVGQNYYPVKMLRLFSEMDNEKVRSVLKYLIDESLDVQERMLNTEIKLDGLLEQYNKINKKNLNHHYIGDRFLAVMLYFVYPEKYYLYKFSMFKKFCRIFSLTIPKMGADDNVVNFWKLCDSVRNMLLGNEELVKTNKSMLDETCYPDGSLHLLTQDFIYACSTYLADDPNEDDGENPKDDDQHTRSELELPPSRPDKAHYWLLAPGAGAHWWNQFYEQGIAAIGWNKVGNLTQYPSREAIAEKLRVVYPENKGNNRHNTLALWNFSRDLKKGDIVIAKKGTTDYLGYGIVTGDYEYIESSTDFPHQRKVNWLKKGIWPETDGQIVTKFLTDITKYPAYVERLIRKLGIVEGKTEENNVRYWWLNASPKVWKITDFEIGQEQSYTTFNENGNKRRVYEYFKEVKPGDLIIGYESSPTLKVIAIMEVTKGIFIDEDDGKEKISFVINEFFSNPVSWADLSGIAELLNCEVLKNNQGSLFKLTPSEYNAIVKASGETETGPANQYEIEDALKEIFLSADELNKILRLLEKKKNILLQGPPGVGKTFLAKRLAYLWMESKDNDKIEMVQFHQSYSYEDFIQGYRPTEDGNFKLLNGIFYRFCKKAMRNPQEDYFFIIDEINRGNLSKIFGELMMLIESDKHGEEFSIPLIYSPDNVTRFYIPNNLYIIGTMNTADRSLAIVDYALRRRFAFIDIEPSFGKSFTDYLKGLKVSDVLIKRIIDRISYLNTVIMNDRNLGKGFLLGHSYFCHPPTSDDHEQWYSDVIEYEIAPILKEYWFDDHGRAEDQIERLY